MERKPTGLTYVINKMWLPYWEGNRREDKGDGREEEGWQLLMCIEVLLGIIIEVTK